MLTWRDAAVVGLACLVVAGCASYRASGRGRVAAEREVAGPESAGRAVSGPGAPQQSTRPAERVQPPMGPPRPGVTPAHERVGPPEPPPTAPGPNGKLLAELQLRDLNAHTSVRGVIVTLADVLFEFGSAELTSEARRRIQDIADVLHDVGRGRRVAVEGHTDSIGAALYNQGLSERRAARVASSLAAEGVPEALISMKGYGSTFPVAPNTNDDGSDNPIGRARNRRVEVVILN